jgi:hypothetical protein
MLPHVQKKLFCGTVYRTWSEVLGDITLGACCYYVQSFTGSGRTIRGYHCIPHNLCQKIRYPIENILFGCCERLQNFRVMGLTDTRRITTLQFIGRCVVVILESRTISATRGLVKNLATPLSTVGGTVFWSTDCFKGNKARSNLDDGTSLPILGYIAGAVKPWSAF